MWYFDRLHAVYLEIWGEDIYTDLTIKRVNITLKLTCLGLVLSILCLGFMGNYALSQNQIIVNKLKP